MRVSKECFSARLSSRGIVVLIFVFSKDSVLFCNSTVFSDVLTRDCCCPPLLLLHREGNGFPMHARRFIFASTLWRILFHGRLWRFAHTLSKFSSFCAINITWVWKIFYSYFSVSRSMRLWDTDLPESSEPYVTLDSRSSPIRTTFGVHTSFFPGSHLRVSRTPQTFGVTWRILSHKYAVPRDETTCACFHIQRELSEGLPQDLFIGTNSCAKL